MNFDLAVPLAQNLLLLGCDILIAKEHHASLRDQQTQLILLFISQVFQLQSNNLGACKVNVCGKASIRGMYRCVQSSG